MFEFGSQFSFVGLTVELRSVGRVPLIIGRGVAAIVGEAARGPVGEVVLLGTSADARALFHSGPVCDGIETLFAQGVDVVAATRVGGTGIATAEAEIKTGGVSPDPPVVGVLRAVSGGAWGNHVRGEFAEGSYPSFEVGSFIGDGTVGPYFFDNWDLVEDVRNYLLVSGVAKIIVYKSEDLATGKVFFDKTKGSVLFFDGEGPTAANVVDYSVQYKTRKLILTDGRNTEMYPVSSYIKLQAALLRSGIGRYDPVPGETHLPAVGAFWLAGGSNGSPATLNDWKDALALLLRMPEGVVPTTVVLTDHEVQEDTNDLIPVLDGFTTEAANRFVPMIGFVAAKKNSTMSDLLHLKSSYNNPFMVIVGNGWDNSTPERNLAVARAGTETALPLGDSAAEINNAIKGANSLLVQFSPEEVDVLTYNSVDVIVKEWAGIKPYVGVTTAADDNFLRCVDMRTIAHVMNALNYIAKRFYHRRRTRQNLAAMKGTLDSFFEELHRLQIIDDWKVAIRGNPLDRNKVDIDLWIQCVGHIERIHTVLSVGYWSSRMA